VILLIGFALAVALVGCSARALEGPTPDRASEAKPDGESHWLDVLLFVVLLIGTVRAHKRKQEDEDG
jgi:hypothetical protein